MFVNMLPSQTRLKIQFRGMFRCYAVVWGLGGLAVAAYAMLIVAQLWQAQGELAVLEQRCQPIYALQRKMARNQQQLKLAESQLAKLNELQPSNHFLDLLGVLVEATRTESGKLHIQRLSLTSGQNMVSATGAPGGSKPSSSRPRVSTLSLSGIADDDASLTQFVATLRQVDVFDQVDLKASSQVAGEDRTARQYQLECRYQDVP